MRFLIILTIFFPVTIYGFQVIKNGSKIILKAETCKLVQSIVNDISKWKKVSDGEVCTSSPIPQLKDGCTADITSCIPSRVNKFLSQSTKYSGPNCFNLALVAAGILPALTYTTPEEIAYYLNSPLCRQMKQTEEKNPGDLGIIQCEDDEAFHAFVYISHKLVLHKDSVFSGPEGGYFLISKQDVKNYLEPRPNSISIESKCRKNKEVYFRCLSMDTYLKSHKKASEELIAKMNDLLKVETCCLQPAVLDGNPLSEQNKKMIRSTIDLLSNFLKTKKTNNLDEDEKFILGSLHLRLVAAQEQLALIEKTDANRKKQNTFLQSVSNYLKSFAKP